MSSELASQNHEYRQWLSDLKSRYRQVQLKAALTVNTALLQFYWQLGSDILVRQASASWGQGFLAQISADLMQEFPGVAGFSERNLKYIRQWVLFWGAGTEPEPIGQQAVAQLQSIPCPKPCRASCPALSNWGGNWGRGMALIRQKLGGLGYEF